jgi:hypothetical protein
LAIEEALVINLAVVEAASDNNFNLAVTEADTDSNLDLEEALDSNLNLVAVCTAAVIWAILTAILTAVA